MLHITNGDSAAISIRQTGVAGEVISWRDVLHEGPVPSNLPLEAMSEVRARFLSAVRWSSFPEALRQYGARDIALRAARRVTLWFEHDLYDQLQLIQILAALAQQPDTEASLIAIDSFPGFPGFRGLGELSPAQLASLWPQRQPVTAAHLTLGARAWKAFTSSDPLALPAFLGTDLSALPLLRPALVRLLEEYPSAPSGLSRTDRQILEAVAAGATQFGDLFARAQRAESASFHGDSSIQLHVDELISARTPLLTAEPYRLTDAGRRVLAGEVDARQLNGLDRWIGGVHLKQ
ncbi:MAG: DUF1835 domain-containing protein [Verrucomicrobiota bacterium]